MTALIVILIYLACLGVSFLATSGLIRIVCWAFSLAFSWKIAVGVWIILCIIGGLFKVNVHVEK